MYIFSGCYDGHMYKIEVENGAICWSFKTEDMIKSKAVVAMGESLFFGSYDKYLYSINNKVSIFKYYYLLITIEETLGGITK
jgi:outer membrane protein assembly factor BamB